MFQSLYLEGNQLTELPDHFFSKCSNLKWLDLRNNQLKVLPPSIEKLRYILHSLSWLPTRQDNLFPTDYRCLKTLLLEGNQLVSLPVQLCRLPHLTGLNISHNPLKNPPRDVIDKGTKVCIYVGAVMLDLLMDVLPLGCTWLLARDAE